MEERLLRGKEKQEKLSCNVESLWSVCTNHTGSVPTPGQPPGKVRTFAGDDVEGFPSLCKAVETGRHP